MARVEVALPGRSYPVFIGQGALQELPKLVREMGVSGAAIVTDTTVGKAWGGAVETGLTGVGVNCRTLAVEPGEGSKSLAELERVLAFLEELRIDRRGIVLALGGGTVGDLAGFAAAVWLRGVRVVQVPTTLLAMVDSSVGGKTGVNTKLTKNSVGAFWQPAAVVAELATLGTLPESEYVAAFAEIVKYAVAMDAGLFEILDARWDGLGARSADDLEAVVARCVELKAKVVAMDERDQGARAILNYGHTFAHALEAASGYRLAHGHAVSYGLLLAARLGVAVGLCGEEVDVEQTRLLARYGLPPGPLEVPLEAALAALPRDKKATGGRIGWVLPRAIGKAQVGVQVPEAVVEREVRLRFG